MQLVRGGGRTKEDSNESETETDLEDSTFSNEEIIFPTQEKHTGMTSIPNRNHLFFIIPSILVIRITGIFIIIGNN